MARVTVTIWPSMLDYLRTVQKVYEVDMNSIIMDVAGWYMTALHMGREFPEVSHDWHTHNQRWDMPVTFTFRGGIVDKLEKIATIRQSTPEEVVYEALAQYCWAEGIEPVRFDPASLPLEDQPPPESDLPQLPNLIDVLCPWKREE